mmetsp:Transcript_38048/g.63857  ORF Transcript_38048/g.63857 Transcript_38048/m.63857 type:complete len:93 (-) Transcript_38048:287-565(-)
MIWGEDLHEEAGTMFREQEMTKRIGLMGSHRHYSGETNTRCLTHVSTFTKLPYLLRSLLSHQHGKPQQRVLHEEKEEEKKKEEEEEKGKEKA